MFGRDNLIGMLLLLFCGVVVVILLWSIATGEQLSVNVPPVVGWIIGILFIGGIIYGFTQGSLFRRLRGGQGGRQWPDPNTGRKSLWDRLRGR
jgi:hypothetical protein